MRITGSFEHKHNFGNNWVKTGSLACHVFSWFRVAVMASSSGCGCTTSSTMSMEYSSGCGCTTSSTMSMEHSGGCGCTTSSTMSMEYSSEESESEHEELESDRSVVSLMDRKS